MIYSRLTDIIKKFLLIGSSLHTAMGSEVVLPNPEPTASIKEVIAVVPASFPPYYHLDYNGVPTGFAIKSMNVITRRAGLRLHYQYDSFEQAFFALQAAQIEALPYPNSVGWKLLTESHHERST